MTSSPPIRRLTRTLDSTGRQTDGYARPRLPLPFAACSVAVGMGVLVGWALGLEGLTRVFPASIITMKPNAALAFLLSGLGGSGRSRGRPGGQPF